MRRKATKESWYEECIIMKKSEIKWNDHFKSGARLKKCGSSYERTKMTKKSHVKK